MQRLFLHVGLMKSGTTYLQQVWRANAESLEEQGIWTPSREDEPGTRFAVWDLAGRRPRGAADARVAGQWEALTDAVAARSDQTVLLSEEYLAARTPGQARRAVAGFPGHDVHVVVTVRDFGRVLASAWQEEVKSGSTNTWSEFIAAVRDSTLANRDPARGFWLRHDLAGVLETWTAVVDESRVHVVTVPPEGSPRELLLERMGTVVGFDAGRLTNAPRGANQSLGAPATEVIRRLNDMIGDRLNQRQYDWVVKRTFESRLPPADARDRLVLPSEHLDWARGEAERMTRFVREHGYDVVGDLDELVPTAAGAGRIPEQATDAELLEAAMRALSVLAEQAGKAWWSRRRPEKPRVPPASRTVRVTSAVRGAGFRLRRRGAALADRNAAASAAMGVYLRTVRRNTAPRARR